MSGILQKKRKVLIFLSSAFSTNLEQINQGLVDWALAAENSDDRTVNEAANLFGEITRAVASSTAYGAKGEGDARKETVTKAKETCTSRTTTRQDYRCRL